MTERNQKALVFVFSIIAVCLVILTYYVVSDTYAYDFDKVAKFCKQDNGTCESITIAYQLGRLDFVSVCLAMLGVIVGLSAIFGFLSIREKSELIAANTAKKTITEFIEKDIKASIMLRVEEAVSEITRDGDAIVVERTNVEHGESEWGENL